MEYKGKIKALFNSVPNYNTDDRAVIGSKPNEQQHDIQNEKNISTAIGINASENKEAGKRSIVTDLSQDVSLSTVLTGEQFKQSSNVISDEYTRLSQDVVSGRIDYSSSKKQIIVYNPTTTVLKLSIDRVDTNSYMFTVKANQMVILPPLNFSKLYYLQETIQTGIYATPIIFAYSEAKYAAGIYTI